MDPSKKVRSNLIITLPAPPPPPAKNQPRAPKQSLDKELCVHLLRPVQLDFAPKKALRENRSQHQRNLSSARPWYTIGDVGDGFSKCK